MKESALDRQTVQVAVANGDVCIYNERSILLRRLVTQKLGMEYYWVPVEGFADIYLRYLVIK